MAEIDRVCDIVRWPGGKYVEFLKSIAPSFLRPYQRIFVVLDDIMFDTPLKNWNYYKFVEIAERNNLTVASPGITGSTAGLFMHPSINSSPTIKFRRNVPEGTVGRLVSSVEVQATIFTPAAFKCFTELLDVKRNFYGWHYDSYFNQFCASKVPGWRMGIIDDIEVCTPILKRTLVFCLMVVYIYIYI